MEYLKYKLSISTLVVVFLSVFLMSCHKDFDEYNTDPNGIINALPEKLLAPALVNVLTYNMTRNRNFNNELSQVSLIQEDADGRVFRYDYNASWADYTYNGWYSELTNLKDIYNLASEEVNYNPSYKGISLICQAWVYSLLTDTYGDVPFSEANIARDSAVYEPEFDRQKDIYTGIFRFLDSANVYLKEGAAITATSDPVYNGDVAKWRKLGNSLYLRLLLRISGKSEIADSVIAKINQIVSTPKEYPIMSGNEDAAYLKWTGEGAYVSPYMSLRSSDFISPAICSFFIDNLVAWNDPRINDVQYGDDGICRWRIKKYNGNYVGIPSGYAKGQGEDKKSYFLSTTSSSTLMNDPYTGIIMNYAELQFILAEAATKGWISGDPKSYYNEGVESSITYWLPNWSEDVETYLENADMQWLEADSQEEKMEKIHLQKYYALFLVDFQQWFEIRRTGYPILPKGDGLLNNGEMPSRMYYPTYVQSANPTNYAKAIANQGPDLISTKVWWQKQ